MPNLLHTHPALGLRNANLGERRRQRFARHADQRRLRRRRVVLERPLFDKPRHAGGFSFGFG
jgi:hypothetical protein